METSVPEGIYLCQINENISCGACCGLYNIVGLSRESLESMLARRTEAFADVRRDMNAILAFPEWTKATESQQRPYPDFHHCPYLGMVGRNRSRVGCLLHPKATGNNGLDFRGLSYYGGFACNTYFCPSYRTMNSNAKQILRHIPDDWYLYGLVITEADLINSFFSEMHRRTGRRPIISNIEENKSLRQAVMDFLEMKINWPFRGKHEERICHYFFKDGLYPKPEIGIELPKNLNPAYPILMREFVSEFRSMDEVETAVLMIDDSIDLVVKEILKQ